MGSELVQDLLHFPRFWYIEIPAWWLGFLKRVMVHFDNNLAVTLMVQTWLVPVWQDRTIIGRGLSIIFRTIRVVFGSFLLLFILITLTFLLIFWLLLPLFLLLYSPKFLVLIPIFWLLDASGKFFSRQQDPLQKLLNKAQGDINRLQNLLLEAEQVKNLLASIEQDQLPDKKIDLNIPSLVQKAEAIRAQAEEKKLKVEHLFIALLEELKFHSQDALSAYLFQKSRKSWANPPWIWQEEYENRPIGGINRTWTGMITPELDKYSTDLTQLAARGKLKKIIGRQKIIEEIVRTLGKEGRENVLIIGEAGSGKTTIVEGLANEIIQGTEYKSLQFKRLIALDLSALTAGSDAKIKERLNNIIEEIKFAGNVILYVDEIHNLVSEDSGQQTSIVFSALEPHLDAGELQFVAATTPAGFKRCIEPSSAFVRTFHVVKLPEAGPEDTLEIAKWKAFELESSHHLQFSFLAVKSSIELARRYIQDRVLPDSAVNLLEESANKAKYLKKTWIRSQDIEQMVTDITQIPVRSADSKEERKILLNLEKELHKKVIGQEKAVEEVADALRRARTGLAEEGRLLASFLFAGATGVGKTETAKALAQVYFGSQDAMIRLDMSEYQTEDSINRLIGPPPGSEGYELGGQLTEAVRRRPFTVILTDELEKANLRILDVFLQLLDDARLTDGAGRTVDFSNTILIATSNVGTQALMQGIEKGEDYEKVKKDMMDNLRQQFRPEFLNRFTDIIVYKPLNQEQIRQIAKLQLERLIKKLGKKEIKFKISEELVNFLVEKGFSPVWGARELNRAIRDEVEEKIAKKILEGKIEKGKTYILTPEFLL